ncbi:hypothetical protein I6B53_00185 [Schaalia sp. 19OD2882]|uniref:hypothetical protein n=1 Tax=Schaalia sp. 19OD2882 TaxID=2794089 RepID=UPI001C1EEBD5|nr:hypothetical protein [Schaalia sp. 19OD2882]QWW19606.1 hypothetical protein I6B53_00185 [Schaalia sp. 19OD2882]
MAKNTGLDTDKLKTEALQIRDAVAVHAGRVAVAATDLAEQGLDWAAPRAQAALETAIQRATPLVESAADRAQDAAERAKPIIGDVRERVVDDYLPRIHRAVEESGSALSANGSLVERATRARELGALALTTPTRKVRRKRTFLKVLGWTAATGAVVGIGYLLWKRSQPIEDPWAEEYWADLESDTIVPAMEPEKVEESPEDDA